MALDNDEMKEVKKIAVEATYEALGNTDEAKGELRKRGYTMGLIKAMHRHIRDLEKRIKKLEK